MFKRTFIVCSFFTALILAGCSATEDISGTYVHYKGTKVYYTVGVKKTGHSTVEVVFEGVPLDLMKRLPWSMHCDGQIQGEFLKCAKNTIVIKSLPRRLDVTYKDGKKQVFINSLEDPVEIIKNYD